MPSSAQQEAVALWLYYESRGFKPSVSSVMRALRGQGLKFRTNDACRWLSKFSGKRPGNSPETLGKRDSSTAETGGKQSGTTRDVSSCAPELVSLVSKETTSLEPVGTKGEPLTGLEPKVPRRPSERDLAAYAILDVAFPIIRENVEIAHNQKIWKQRNKHAALDLVDSGRNPNQVRALLETAYDDSLEGTEFYSRISTLAKLAEHWGALVHLDRNAEPKKKPKTYLRVL